MANIFNGTKEFAGYFEAFSGGKTSVKIGKAGDVGDGFMVNQYAVRAARGIGMQRFMNVEGVVAHLGTVNGTVTLTGLIGRKKDFIKIAESSANGSICGANLTVEIDTVSGFHKCDDSDGSEYALDDATKIICSGGVLTQIDLTGTIDQQGVLMQTGTLTIQFTALEIK